MAASTIIGLDIGSTSVRAVETDRSKTHPVVVGFGHEPLPAGAVRGGVIHDQDAVVNALRTMWQRTPFKSKAVVLGVSSHHVVVREMAMPDLPDRELRAALPLQVHDVLPMPPEKALLDFYPLEPRGRSLKRRGLLIAAPKDQVMAAVQAIGRAGLTVAHVDLASFAVLRAAGRPGRGVEAIVDLGAHTTTVLVHSNGQPSMIRTVPRGGSDVTQAVASRLNVDIEQAEALKRRVGVVLDDDAFNTLVVEDALRSLVSEIRSSLAYVASADRSTPVASLALCGGGAQLPGISEYLTRQLGVDVTLADPLVRMDRQRGHRTDQALTTHGSAATVSLGLTLAAAA